MFRFSDFGQRFSQPSGALELMDDLGRAVVADDVAFLGGGNPAKIPAVQALLRKRVAEVAADPAAFDRMISNYAHPTGDLPFRTALAKLLTREYGWPLTEHHIALTAGSQASFFLLFNLFAGRHDGHLRRVLLPMAPEYVGYANVSIAPDSIVARRPKIEHTSHHSFKYRLDFDGLTLSDDVAAVCVSRPTNPTGNVLTDDEVRRLAKLAANAGIPLIVDGAYGPPFPNIVFQPVEPLWDVNMILCLSLSKLGMPGVRTGIVIARPEVIDAVTSMTAVLNLAVGSVGPVLAQPLVERGEILSLGPDHIMPFYRDKAQRAREIFERELAGLPFRIHEPEGAFFLWLWFPDLPIPSAELYRRLKASGVLVLSGHYFFPGFGEPWRHRDECIRISYAQDDTVIAHGARAIAREVRAAYEREASKHEPSQEAFGVPAHRVRPLGVPTHGAPTQGVPAHRVPAHKAPQRKAANLDAEDRETRNLDSSNHASSMARSTGERKPKAP